MTATQELRVELAAQRVLLKEMLGREWTKVNRDPNWADGLRVDSLERINKDHRSDPLCDEIRKRLIDITLNVLPRPVP